jgi:hypothetical protein
VVRVVKPSARFLLTIAAVPGSLPPPIVRLRAMLKSLRRRHGFRVERVEELPPARSKR